VFNQIARAAEEESSSAMISVGGDHAVKSALVLAQQCKASIRLVPSSTSVIISTRPLCTTQACHGRADRESRWDLEQIVVRVPW